MEKRGSGLVEFQLPKYVVSKKNVHAISPHALDSYVFNNYIYYTVFDFADKSNSAH